MSWLVCLTLTRGWWINSSTGSWKIIINSYMRLIFKHEFAVAKKYLFYLYFETLLDTSISIKRH